MYAAASAYRRHGIITTPITAVISPPVTYEIRRGERFEKSFDGETTLAAMLVVSWAASTTSAAKTITPVPPMRLTSTTGSQIASPKITMVAQVTATPMKAKSVIVVGRPSACPSTWERWFFAYRVKSGILRLSVAQ